MGLNKDFIGFLRGCGSMGLNEELMGLNSFLMVF
jgi:hypothetical protein